MLDSDVDGEKNDDVDGSGDGYAVCCPFILQFFELSMSFHSVVVIVVGINLLMRME